MVDAASLPAGPQTPYEQAHDDHLVLLCRLEGSQSPKSTHIKYIYVRIVYYAPPVEDYQVLSFCGIGPDRPHPFKSTHCFRMVRSSLLHLPPIHQHHPLNGLLIGLWALSK